MPSGSAPRLSIVVLAYGNRPVSERCLETIEAAFGPELGRACELVLVDNASPDDTAELFASWSDRAVVALLEENRNFAGGCNEGARLASGDVLVFLNNDTEVGAGALEALAAQALEPGVGAVGARLLYPDGTIQHGGMGWMRRPEGDLTPFHLFRGEPGDLPAAGAVIDMDVVTGACLAVRRELFLAAGGFDESFVNGWEDVDLCLRLRIEGHRNVYRGDVSLVHAEGASRGIHDSHGNAPRFMERWASLLDADDAVLAQRYDLMTNPRAWVAAEPSADRIEGVPVAISGPISAPGAGGDEARALIEACEASGLRPAARDAARTNLSPRLAVPEWQALIGAFSRAVHPSAVTVAVPGGAAPGRRSVPAGAVARLAALPPDGIAAVSSVWAASPALADELVAAGLPAERVAWLPAPVREPVAGPGGEGLLALLPAQHLALCADLLDALAGLGAAVRLLPTAAGAAVEALVRERLPAAELLAPVSAERRFAELCRGADAVLCLDPSDRFERRALVAAGAGAAAVSRTAGPATAVLGHELAAGGPSGVRLAVETALDRKCARAERSALVDSICGPAAIAARLAELVPAARRLRDEHDDVTVPAPATAGVGA